MGRMRPAWSAEPAKPLLAPASNRIPKCLLRVQGLGDEGAGAPAAASMTKALADTAGKLGVALDGGAAGTPHGVLVIALDGKNDAALK